MAAASEPGWLTGLNFTLTDAPTGGGASASGGAAMPNSGAGGGGSFSLSVDEARSMLTTAKRVRDQLQNVSAKAEVITHVKPPTDDPGSVGYNQLLVGGSNGQGAFVEGKKQVDREYSYIVELVRRLEQALGIVESTDEQSAAGVPTTGTGDQDKGFA